MCKKSSLQSRQGGNHRHYQDTLDHNIIQQMEPFCAGRDRHPSVNSIKDINHSSCCLPCFPLVLLLKTHKSSYNQTLRATLWARVSYWSTQKWNDSFSPGMVYPLVSVSDGSISLRAATFLLIQVMMKWLLPWKIPVWKHWRQEDRIT